jgi:hypothetical protein
MSTSVLRYSGVTNDNRGYEIWRCETTAATTINVITPLLLKGVDMVTITPADADACAQDIGYLTAFVPCMNVVTITMKTTAIYFVKLEGTVS